MDTGRPGRSYCSRRNHSCKWCKYLTFAYWYWEDKFCSWEFSKDSTGFSHFCSSLSRRCHKKMKGRGRSNLVHLLCTHHFHPQRETLPRRGCTLWHSCIDRNPQRILSIRFHLDSIHPSTVNMMRFWPHCQKCMSGSLRCKLSSWNSAPRHWCILGCKSGR